MWPRTTYYVNARETSRFLRMKNDIFLTLADLFTTPARNKKEERGPFWSGPQSESSPDRPRYWKTVN